MRSPTSGEIDRVLHLFRNQRLRVTSRFLVAERTHPIARFVGAVAWWVEGMMARFQLAAYLSPANTGAIAKLIEGVVNAGRELGLEMLQYAELLPEGSVWGGVLEAQGFERVRSERSFEIAYGDAWTRTMRLYERHRGEIPATWRTDPIREHRPETILGLAEPHRLLPPEELRQYWQATTTAGFDLELSCILFDQDRPFGTFLVRRLAEGLYIDAQIVHEPNPRRRSLGDLLMLYHDASRVTPDGPIRWIRFRRGTTEHRQTANLALRMGGHELPRHSVFARRLLE